MSYFMPGLVGASLVALSVGFGPLAAGALSPQQSAGLSSAAQYDLINRDAKGDRLVTSSFVSGNPATIIQVENPGQTSVAIKPKSLPRKEALYGFGIAHGKKINRAVACEPVVSVLTEVARLLEPGRCVT